MKNHYSRKICKPSRVRLIQANNNDDDLLSFIEEAIRVIVVSFFACSDSGLDMLNEYPIPLLKKRLLGTGQKGGQRQQTHWSVIIIALHFLNHFGSPYFFSCIIIIKPQPSSTKQQLSCRFLCQCNDRLEQVDGGDGGCAEEYGVEA